MLQVYWHNIKNVASYGHFFTIYSFINGKLMVMIDFKNNFKLPCDGLKAHVTGFMGVVMHILKTVLLK